MADPLATASEPVGSAPGPVLGLGQLIDGFRRLSPVDKQVFCLANGLTEATVPGSTGLVFQAVGAAAPVQVLGPGHTRDPKTGKVFKVTPKKGHSVERQSLEVRLKDAKSAFTLVLKRHKITIGDDGIPSAEGNPADDVRAEYSVALNRVNSAKALLAAYKAAHPEEFKPPPVKKVGGPSAPPQAAKDIKPFPPSPNGDAAPSGAAANAAAAAGLPLSGQSSTDVDDGTWQSQAPVGANQW